MKKRASAAKKRRAADDMRPEYDFRGGVRGKHYREYREGYSVTLHEADGSLSLHDFAPRGDAVVLAPDVQKYFPDSRAVNEALRTLIRLVPRRSRTAARR